MHLVIMSLPKPLNELAIDLNDVREQWRKYLAKDGLKLGPPDEAPTLRLAVTTHTDAVVSNAVSYVNILTLEQNVHIEGREHAHRIPTWTGLQMGMNTKKHLAKDFEASLNRSITHFLARVDMATRQEQ